MKIYHDYKNRQASLQTNDNNYLLLPQCRNKTPKYPNGDSHKILGEYEKLNQINKFEIKSKEINNKTKKMDRSKLSINILQLLLKQIFKLKNGYEKTNNSETLSPFKDKTNETEVDMMLKCFRDFYLVLMQITRNNNSNIQLNYLMEPILDSRDRFSVNRTDECQNTILELFKAKDIQLKSRKYIDTTKKIEEIVFIYQRKQSDDILYPSENNNYHLPQNALSFSLIEVLNKEHYENFLSVTRHIVCCCNIIIHQNSVMYKAPHMSILSLTPELYRIKDSYQSIFDSEHCKLDFSCLKSDKSNTNTKLDSNFTLENVSKGCGSNDMSKIYSCLKSIESLTKDMPRLLLKNTLNLKNP